MSGVNLSTECCCGTCEACLSANACDKCRPTISGVPAASWNTPTQWHVTVDGVDTGMPCIDCTPPGIGALTFSMQGGIGSINGTYTLTQDLDSVFTWCVWTTDRVTPLDVMSWTGSNHRDCSDPFTIDATVILLTKGTGSIGLYVQCPSGGVIGSPFKGSASTNDTTDDPEPCCRSYEFTSDYTDFACTDGAGTRIIGKGGTAVATLC